MLIGVDASLRSLGRVRPVRRRLVIWVTRLDSSFVRVQPMLVNEEGRRITDPAT